MLKSTDMIMHVRAESFFHSLEVEFIHGESFAIRMVMCQAVFDYIERDYNRWCCHNANSGLS
ncbi:transposase (fragment) [Xenorhabdus bovienii str. puntauvense]|uniref:Transposase n=1 Tax=Xenorhabdus bovienii str. puntauvense TaxID=1398201 RepID=A0A077NC24_XENBV